MRFVSVPLGSTHTLNYSINNPTTNEGLPPAEVTQTISVYRNTSGSPATVSAQSRGVDGLFYCQVPVSKSLYTVNDFLNVVLEATVDGVTTRCVIATILVAPPYITGAVTAGTSSNSATSFCSNLVEGDLVDSVLSNVTCHLRSSDGITFGTGSAVATWASQVTGSVDFTQGTNSLRPSLTSNVVDFDGTDDYLLASDNTAMEPSTAWTIAMRIRIDNHTTTSQMILCKGTNSGGEWALQLNFGELRFFFATGAWVNYGYKSSAFASAGTYTLVIVYDGGGSTNADKLKFWIDGVAQTLAFSGTIPTSNTGSSNSVGLGGANNGTQPFNGAITELVCAKTVANATQVADITDLLTNQRVDFWKGCLLLFTSGALAGQVRKITGFDRTNRFLSFTDGFSQTPATGDQFVVLNT